MAWSRPMIWVRNILLGLVIVAFIAFFGQPRGGRSSGTVVAKVGGDTIRRDVFFFWRDRFEDLSRDSFPPDADRTQVEDLLDRQTLGTLIHRVILAQEARALGLEVPDQELARALVSVPGFRGADGRFDRNAFERFWRNAGFQSDRTFAEEQRQLILIRKLQRLVLGAVRVSDARARDALRRDRTRIRLRYAAARPDDLRQRIVIPPEDLDRFVAGQPERLKGAYQKRIDEFRKPEEVHAAHILFQGEDALEQARAARERLQAGESFESLARELSRDQATREEGGDLGFFPRGRMMPAFEEAAFGLQAGEVSEPVETERGVHLVRVLERRAAVERPLEQVSQELAREELTADRAREAASRAAEDLLARLQAGGEFLQSARKLGLPVEETPAFGYRDLAVPGIGRIPGLAEAALDLRADQPYARRVFSDGETSFVISLLERDEPDPASLEADAQRMQEQMESQARDRLLSRWSDRRRDQLQRAGKLVRYPLSPVL